MASYNIMDVAIALELALIAIGMWALINPAGYDRLHRRIRRWERRTWHKIIRKIKRALRPLVNRRDESWQS